MLTTTHNGALVVSQHRALHANTYSINVAKQSVTDLYTCSVRV